MLKSLSIVALLTVVSCSDDSAGARPGPDLFSYYLEVRENGTTTIDVSELDAEGQDPAPSYSNTQPLHGTVTVSGTVFTYAPASHYDGPDQFDIVRTMAGSTTKIPVTITVTHGDDAPVAQDLEVVLNQDDSVSTELVATDSDSAILTYTVVTPPAHGTLIGTPPALVYAPSKGYVGTDGFTFKANDGELDSQLGVVSLTINAQ
jgi:hypothetical protein